MHIYENRRHAAGYTMVSELGLMKLNPCGGRILHHRKPTVALETMSASPR